MRIGERGYALVLVLILLAVGSLALVPTLRLADTSLKAKRIYTDTLKEQYSRDGAAEHAIWRLQYEGLAQTLTEANPEENYTLTLNGVSAGVVIRLEAKPGLGGAALAADVRFQPTKTVTPETYTGGPQTFTYTLTIHRVSPDEPANLDAIIDVMDDYDEDQDPFAYVPGSSILTTYAVNSSQVLSVETLADPDLAGLGDDFLRWPASGNFPSAVSGDIGYFQYDQKKDLTFQMTASGLDNNRWYCNHVILKPFDEYSGATAPIKVGTAVACQDGLLEMDKTVTPVVIQPEVPTTVTYTITLKNVDLNPHYICHIRDVLPENVVYLTGSANDPQWAATNISTADPAIQPHPTLPTRSQLTWEPYLPPGDPDNWLISPGQTLTQKFQAVATLDESGTSFNEFLVRLDDDDDFDFY